MKLLPGLGSGASVFVQMPRSIWSGAFHSRMIRWRTRAAAGSGLDEWHSPVLSCASVVLTRDWAAKEHVGTDLRRGPRAAFKGRRIVRLAMVAKPVTQRRQGWRWTSVRNVSDPPRHGWGTEQIRDEL